MATKFRLLMYFAFILFLMVACAKHNPLSPADDTNTPLALSEDKVQLGNGDEYLYRQTAKLKSQKEDCLIAWRITTTDSLLPDGIVADAEGWIYHYIAGADTSVPLSSADCQRTIWTSGTEQIWSFTSNAGKLKHIVSKVEVKVKSESGQVIDYINYFNMDRTIGSRIITPGITNGAAIGLGIHVSLQETIGDVYVEGMYAHHFMYRLNKLNSSLNVIQQGQWFSTLDCENIRELNLNTLSTPALTPNQTNEFTQLEVYVVTRQNVSETTHQTIYFRAQGGFHPKTLIYNQLIQGIGQYHYMPRMSDNIPLEPIPPLNSTHHCTPLFKENNVYSAINSGDFKLNLAFGWHGQYGTISSNNYYEITDNPFDRITNLCLDEDTNTNYGSFIEFFDLQLDGQPIPAMSQFGTSQLVTHTDATLWRRIKVLGLNNLSNQNFILTGLANGSHTFKVSAVDGQGVYDPTPAELNFNLVQYKPPSQRTGILIIDDDLNSSSMSPEATIDSIYQYITPTNFGPVAQFDRASTPDDGDIYNRHISPTLLQNYKAVIYHMDNPGVVSNYVKEADGMYLYLSNGGNLVWSSTGFQNQILQELIAHNQGNSAYSFGLANTSDVNYLHDVVKPFFVSAESLLPSLPDLPLKISNSFNSLIRVRQGFYSVNYFGTAANTEPLYSFGCKLTTASVYPPTQADYNLYNGRTVGYRYHAPGGGKAVILGFPLSYMEHNPAQQALQAIISNMLN